MPKGVDGVEGRVARLIDRKIAHVGNKPRRFDPVSLEPLIAKVDRLWVQIKSLAGVATSDHPVEKSTGSASRFQESFGFATHMLCESCSEEFILGCPVATEDQIVVDWVIVDTFLNGLHGLFVNQWAWGNWWTR